MQERLAKFTYALRGMTQPLGVAAYETQKIMDELQASFPTIEELEAKLKDQSEEEMATNEEI